ncbi:biotin--[acetyl-CoA-carboxylase] ligase [Chloroflexota bacterium]
MEDSLSAAAIARDLGTRFMGQKIIYYPMVTSTMEVARQEAQRGVVEGTVLITDEQTAGRGRMRRVWLSPRGNIALSVVLRPDISYLPFLVMIASLAVIQSIAVITGLKPQIKWPNDILVNGKKVCGILIENSIRAKLVDYSIIGIGINVNDKFSQFPEILPFATSLSQELGMDVSRLSVIRQLLIEAEKLYLTLPGQAVYQEWRDNLATLGKRVQVKWNKSEYEGIAESVDADGALLLRHADGTATKFIAGDVTLRE